MFRTEKMIRFHHCDPTGVVFFPQYLVLCHEVIEDWIENGLKIGFRNLLKNLGLCTPTVNLHCDFIAPSRFGERLSFDLTVLRLGNSSIRLAIRAHLSDQVRMRAELVIVLTELAVFRAVPIPDDLRQRMLAFAGKDTSA